MGRKGVETLVGLFVLLGILAILFLALRAANLGNFVVGETYSVTARFDNIGGLKVRAPVKSAGVNGRPRQGDCARHQYLSGPSHDGTRAGRDIPERHVGKNTYVRAAWGPVHRLGAGWIR